MLDHKSQTVLIPESRFIQLLKKEEAFADLLQAYHMATAKVQEMEAAKAAEVKVEGALTKGHLTLLGSPVVPKEES